MLLISQKRPAGNALITVLVIIGVSLLMLGAMLSWMSNNKSLTYRYNQFTRSVAAAEAATEKVILQINKDYKLYGQAYVMNNVDVYRKMVPTKDEDSAWANYTFTDLSGNKGVQVDYDKGTNLVVISSQYRGLLGFPGTFRVSACAQELNSPATVVGGVEQRIQASLIPVFQFAMFYNLDLECSALPVMTVNGPVHCNGDIYLTPHGGLTYNNDVTCTKKILRSAKTGNSYGGTGPVTFKGAKDGGVSTLTLPIGTNNSIAAVREVVEVPPTTENPNTPMGQQRLYNKADLIILVSNDAVRATSGRINNFATTLDVSSFVRTNVYFWNGREAKLVQCTEIDIEKFRTWRGNPILNMLKLLLPGRDVQVVYVADFRTLAPTNQPGIRLVNGQTLPSDGFTVATPHPLYIWGHYNCPNVLHLATTNTTETAPAAILADAITVLSPAWVDYTNSAKLLKDRLAADTTVNAAFVAGIVQTSTALGYSGGVENFPRFLEEWGTPLRKLTYNGSMVVMFESKYAKAKWNTIGTYYNPPQRDWSFDTNFRDPLRLPPATPAAYALIRGGWNLTSR